MKPAALFAVLFALLVGARLCHVNVLWAEENLPLAAAAQMRHGAVLYRDAWFDKPPLLAAAYLLWGARDGWPLRLAGALYALGACGLAFSFARARWGETEGRWAAVLTAFFLTFDTASAVLPLAADLLMLVPHLGAVYLAWQGRAFWAGVVAGVAFSINAKGLFVLAACALWSPTASLAAGFLAPNLAIAAGLAWQGALAGYFEQAWKWPRLYAADTFVQNPLLTGLTRTANWLGFHAALVVAARFSSRDRELLAWAALSAGGVMLGWRFFPRYYFLLLPVAVLMAARGLTLLGRKRMWVLALLIVPAARFGPRYFALAAGASQEWADTAMDRDSRQAARLVTAPARPGDTLVAWGFRPELYIYTGLPAASRFLESQPLTGVAADRHLVESRPSLPAGWIASNRRELVRSRPTFIVDGLGPYNRELAITAYPDLSSWLAGYRETARSPGSIVYQRR